jgi:hypothetical protein
MSAESSEDDEKREALDRVREKLREFQEKFRVVHAPSGEEEQLNFRAYRVLQFIPGHPDGLRRAEAPGKLRFDIFFYTIWVTLYEHEITDGRLYELVSGLSPRVAIGLRNPPPGKRNRHNILHDK